MDIQPHGTRVTEDRLRAMTRDELVVLHGQVKAGLRDLHWRLTGYNQGLLPERFDSEWAAAIRNEHRLMIIDFGMVKGELRQRSLNGADKATSERQPMRRSDAFTLLAKETLPREQYKAIWAAAADRFPQLFV